MGASMSLDFETDFLNVKSWTLDHVKELSQAWRDVLNMQFGINKAELHTLISSCSFASDRDFSELVNESWALFNPDDQKLIDTLGVICTFGIECQGSFDDKIDFVFDTFDLNGNGQINKDELTILCLASLLGLTRFMKPGLTPPSDERCEEFAVKAFQAIDKDLNGSISRDEFHVFVKTELDTNLNEAVSDVELMEYFGVVDDVNPDDESEPDDSDIEREAEDFEPLAFAMDDVGEFEGAASILPWHRALVPPASPSSPPVQPPPADLQLEWVHGFHSCSRSNVFRLGNGEIVSHAASVGVVYNITDHSQRHYRGHSGTILCLARHPEGSIVATGDMGPRPEIHVWDAARPEGKMLITVLRPKALHRGVSAMRFSPDGKSLAFVGQDDGHTVFYVNDWRTGVAAGIVSRATGTAKVLDLAVSATHLATVDTSGVRFWPLGSHALLAQPAVLGKRGRKQPFVSAAFFGLHLVAGSVTGRLYLFSVEDYKLVDKIKAHDHGAVNTLYVASRTCLASGGKDGKVKVWNETFECIHTVDLADQWQEFRRPSSVHALQYDVGSTSVLVGTKGSEVIYFNTVDGAGIALQAGHYRGAVWGLAQSTLNPHFVTTGDDRMIRLWDLSAHKCVAAAKLPSVSRCAAYSPDMCSIAVGTGGRLKNGRPAKFDGAFVVVDAETLAVTHRGQDASQPITDIRYSPDGSTLAVACADSCVYLYDVALKYSLRVKCEGHHGSVTHVDFSADSTWLQSTSTEGELFYWDVSTGTQLMDGAADLKDTAWATWTCPVGWPVQGVWSARARPVSSVNAVDRNRAEDLLVTADDSGTVRLMRYPATSVDWPCTEYSGHASAVTNVRWSSDDRYVVALCGTSRAVFQWRVARSKDPVVPIAEGEMEADAVAWGRDVVGEDGGEDDELGAPAADAEFMSYTQQVKARRPPLDVEVAPSYLTVEDVNTRPPPQPQPWQTTIKEPVVAPILDASEPGEAVELEWVHGYEARTMRNSLRYVKGGEAVFSVAGVAVLLTATGAERKQRFFQGEHSDDITALAVNADGTLVATGERGPNPVVYVWDVATLQVQHAFRGHSQGIAHLAFSSDSTLLASVGKDASHTVMVHSLETGLRVGQQRGDNNLILGLDWSPNGPTFMTVGVRHAMVWSVAPGGLTRRSAEFGTAGKLQTFFSVAYLRDGKPIAGARDGSLYMWNKEHRLIKVVAGHDAAVYVVTADKNGGLHSGGGDCAVRTWPPDLASSQVTALDAPVRSVDARDDGVMLVGTLASEVLEVRHNADTPPRVLTRGHAGGEVWGIATSTTRDTYATCGDDGTVRLWERGDKSMLAVADLGGPVRAAAFNPDCSALAVGMGAPDAGGVDNDEQSGAFRVLDGRTLEVLFEGQDASAWVQCVRFSPDGKHLAVASHDGVVYVYATSDDGEYILKNQCSGHDGGVTHLDFTADGVFMQTCSTTGELKYWDVENGDERADGASLLRDSSWASWTCPFGWPVQGVWGHPAAPSRISAVDRAVSGNVVATADLDGRLSLFRYPCVSPAAGAVSLRGHSTNITNVRWTRSDKGLVSVGGVGGSVFQWANRGAPEGSSTKVDLDAAMGVGARDPLQEDFADGPARSPAFAAARAGLFYELQGEERKAAMEVQPWHGAVMAPTQAKEDAPSAAPEAELELEWVHGYSGQGRRSNVAFSAHGAVVYPVASVVVVFDTATRTQRFFRAHSDNVTALAMDPTGTLVASGQLGVDACIYVWDVTTCRVVKRIAGLCHGAVAALAWSADGSTLAAVSEDEQHTLVVVDWNAFTGRVTHKDGQNVVSTHGVRFARGGNTKFADVAFSPDGRWVMAVGRNVVKFFNRRTMRPHRGTVANGARLQPFLSCTYFASLAVAGTADGKFYLFDDRHALVRRVDAHTDAILSLHVSADGETMASGSADGWVRLWDTEFVQAKALDAHEWGCVDASVRGVYLRDDGSAAVGTQGSEVIEVLPGGGDVRRITCGHSWGEAWAVAAHPTKHIFATAGDDGTVRTWKLDGHAQTQTVKIGSLVRALAYNPDGLRLGIGTGGQLPDGRFVEGSQGAWKVLDAETMEVVAEGQDSNRWISVVKYSPDGHTFAVGSRDHKIYLYNVANDYQLRVTLEGHTAPITNFDFTSDGKYLQSTDTNHSLLFWDLATGNQRSNGAAELRDARWATWTCTLGWPVQGLWPKVPDGTHVNAVDRSRNGRFMASADEFGVVRLMDYPASRPGWAHDRHVGHSSHVTSCRWLAGDAALVSLGGHDRAVFVWRATELDGDITPPAKTAVVDDNAVREFDLFETSTEAVSSLSRDTAAAAAANAEFQGESKAGGGESKGEEGGATTESKGEEETKAEPSDAPTSGHDLSRPSQAFSLNWVFGYEAQDVRNSLRYVNGTDVAFSAAAVGVVMTPKPRVQRFNRTTDCNAGCTAGIIGLAPSKCGRYVAVGERGVRPKVVVFDASSGKTLSVLYGHKVGVAHLAFSHGGSKLLTVGIDPAHTVIMYHWRSGLQVMASRGSSSKIMGVAWAPGDRRFATVGAKHLFLWDKRSSHVYKKRRAVIQNQGKLQTFLCATFTRNGTLVAGAADGTLYVFKHDTRLLARVVRDAHRGPVTAIFTAPNGYVLTGSTDKKFKVWESSLASALTTIEFDADIRSVCAARNGSYLVGTRESSIYQVVGGEATLLNEAHHARTGAMGEVWGLATHPSTDELATCGDDGTLRVWSGRQRRLLAKAQLGGLARAVAYHPQGNLLAVGMGGRLGGAEDGPVGEFRVFARDGLETLHAAQAGDQWIQDIKFSPDGSTLAVASHDCNIYLHDTTDGYPLRATCTGHKTGVTHVDFTSDSTFLRSTGSAASGELLFFDATSGERDPDGATVLAEVEWASHTATGGWAVAGVASGTTAVAAAHGLPLVGAVNQDGRVAVHRYPAAPGSAGVTLHGHTPHATNAGWSFDDAFLYTTGGNDRCIMQWRQK